MYEWSTGPNDPYVQDYLERLENGDSSPTATSMLNSDMNAYLNKFSKLQMDSINAQIEAERQNAATANAFAAQQNQLNRDFQQASADKEMAFNAEQAAISREFNASEALKNREWQEMMSNTAYQRAVKDLQAAGLNPLLAVSQGGAAYGQGSQATSQPVIGSRANGSAASASKASAQYADLSGVIKSVMSELSAKLDRENSYKMQSEYLQTMRAVASMNNETDIVGTGLASVLRLLGTAALLFFA